MQSGLLTDTFEAARVAKMADGRLAPAHAGVSGAESEAAILRCAMRCGRSRRGTASVGCGDRGGLDAALARRYRGDRGRAIGASRWRAGFMRATSASRRRTLRRLRGRGSARGGQWSEPARRASRGEVKAGKPRVGLSYERARYLGKNA